MNYEMVKKNIIASGVIPDGYFGGTSKVKFSLMPETGEIITVSDSGCFKAGLPIARDRKEAIWLLENHPLSKVLGHIKEIKPAAENSSKKRFKITIEQTSEYLTDADDREDSPEGEYQFEADNKEAALDELHSTIPIGCLEDFVIIVEETADN